MNSVVFAHALLKHALQPTDNHAFHFNKHTCQMSSYADRFSEALERPGKSVAGVAAAMGVTKQAVYSIRRGQTKAASAENNAAAAMYFECDPSWLARGVGSPNWGSIKSPDLAPAQTRGRIPLISWVQASSWCDPARDSTMGWGNVERWLDSPVPFADGSFALRVRGDSMTAPTGNSRTYPEGCIIFINPELRSPNNGDRIIACLVSSDDVTFKVYKNEDGRQWLQPLNPSHEPIRESFNVIGTVFGKWEDG
ncbi:S24 family peptidase [Pseudomonas sp.]|uniref:LexA family protein n=1 Tax=Pseudomonas sp. TaxID=306 RepID=UPI00257ABB43|nr:S24 family peptidase [Pseudomonas sp.]